MSVDVGRAVCTVAEALALVFTIAAFIRATRRGSLASYLTAVGFAVILFSNTGRSVQKLDEPATWGTYGVAVGSIILIGAFFARIAEDRRVDARHARSVATHEDDVAIHAEDVAVADAHRLRFP